MSIEIVPLGTEIQDQEGGIHVVTDDNSVISNRKLYMTQENHDRVFQEIADMMMRKAGLIQ